MRISRVVNNNMVSVVDERGETLYRGLGIGYGKRPGDTLDCAKIEQQFVLADTTLVRRFDELTIDIDAALIDVCLDVIAGIKAASPRPLSDAIYVMLTDHIYNLVERLKAGIVFDNSVLWNLRQIYPDEFLVARKAVRTLQQRLPYVIDDSEANFVTLHIVNAEMQGDMHKTYQFTKYINDIRDIVLSNLGVEFDADDYRANRFLMHLRFLFERLEREAPADLEVDATLIEALTTRYPAAERAVDKVAAYVHMSIGHELCREERLYLLIHLVQLFRGASLVAPDMPVSEQGGAIKWPPTDMPFESDAPAFP